MIFIKVKKSEISFINCLTFSNLAVITLKTNVMLKNQIDQYDMLLTVENHFNDNVPMWNTNIPITTAKTEFSTKLTALATQVALQLVNPTGATAEKAAARENLEAFAFRISAAVRGYAAQTDKKDLYQRFDYAKTEFTHFREAELVGVVSNMIQDALPIADELENYGVNGDTLEELGVAKTTFGNLMKNPSEAIAKRKAATDKIATLLPPLMDFLTTRMDNLMVAISAAQPEFVDIYHNVRAINETGVNPLSVTITTLEAGTQQPIANAQLEIVGEGITRVSSERGYNTVQNLAAGPHDLSAAHPNFEPQTLHFTVVSGETTELLVQMVRK